MSSAELREMAEERPAAYRDFAERVGGEFGEWLLSHLPEGAESQ